MLMLSITCTNPEGGVHVTLGFLINTVLDPLKTHKAAKPVFNVWPLSARQQNAI